MGTIQQQKVQKSYPFSLELVRILAMWMFVCLHFLGIGGVLEQTNSAYYYLLVTCWKFCAVCIDIFILASCYLIMGEKFRPSKAIRLYLETVFYCLAWYIYAIISGAEVFSTSSLLFQVLCPFTSKQYWLLSGYLMVYLLSPGLKFLVNRLSKRGLLTICLAFFLLFSVWVDLYPYLDINIFNFSNGYSFHWFLVLFFFAAYLRLYAEPKKWKHPWLWYIVCSAAMSGIAILMPIASASFPFLEPWAEHFTRYNSILTTISSIFLFSAFLKLELHWKITQKLIVLAAPLTLGVYLIHENTYSRTLIWHTLFHVERIPETFWVLPQTLIVVTLVYIGCSAVDFIRKIFFSLLENRKFFQKALEQFDRFVSYFLFKCADFLSKKI